MTRLLPLLLLGLFAACSTSPTTEEAEIDRQDPVAMEAGTRHDPALDIAEVPAGHWMCDMGSVHYSSAIEGNGECPVCGMKLTQRTAAAAPAGMGHDHDGDDMHDHDDGADHDHDDMHDHDADHDHKAGH